MLAIPPPTSTSTPEFLLSAGSSVMHPTSGLLYPLPFPSMLFRALSIRLTNPHFSCALTAVAGLLPSVILFLRRRPCADQTVALDSPQA